MGECHRRGSPYHRGALTDRTWEGGKRLASCNEGMKGPAVKVVVLSRGTAHLQPVRQEGHVMNRMSGGRGDKQLYDFCGRRLRNCVGSSFSLRLLQPSAHED